MKKSPESQNAADTEDDRQEMIRATMQVVFGVAIVCLGRKHAKELWIATLGNDGFDSLSRAAPPPKARK